MLTNQYHIAENPGYDIGSMPKWSEYTFETPFNPITATETTCKSHDSSSETNFSGTSTYQHRSVPDAVESVDYKIRKHIQANAYSYDYKSLPVMSNFKPNNLQKGLVGGSINNGGSGYGNIMSDTINSHRSSIKTLNLNSLSDNDSQFSTPINKSNNLNNINTQDEAFPIVNRPVTLSNHSKHSRFVSVPITLYSQKDHRPSVVSSELPNNNSGNNNIMETDTLKIKTQKYPRCMQTPNAEEENLLTSERTHFRPIKQTYCDGYTFEIPSNLDEINLTRSESGSMYLDSEKYMEYNANDNVTSSCDCSEDVSKNEFILKFKIKQNEIACQTDEQFIIANRSVNMFNSNLQRIGDYRSLTPSDIDMEHEIVSCFNDRNGIATGINEELFKKKDLICKTGNNLDMDEWIIHTENKKCVNTNSTWHKLWAHCLECKCECEVVSMPANRLLKDELCADGDEIMSHLKYMQNLYIGSDWEDDVYDESANIDLTVVPTSVYYPQSHNWMTSTHCSAAAIHEPQQIICNVDKFVTDLLKPEQTALLAEAIVSQQNTGRNIFASGGMTNIAYLQPSLKPTNLVLKGDYSSKAQDRTNNVSKNLQTTPTNNNNNDNISEKYMGGLWSNENGIWRKEISPDMCESSDSSKWPNIATNKSRDSTAIGWEHAHLEEIWTTKKSHQLLEMETPPPSSEQSYDISNETLQKFILQQVNNRKIQTHVTGPPENSFFQNSKETDCYNNNNSIVKKRCDRKRRHSASQHFTETHDAISSENSLYNKELNVTAIITCKYWTPPDGTDYNLLSAEIDEGRRQQVIGEKEGPPPLSIDMNTSSILKHIMVSSRPLTR